MKSDEQLYAMMVENEIDEKIIKKHELEGAATHKVEFDTKGITDRCPKQGFIYYDECRECPNYLGHEGFTVYCGYHRLPPAGSLGSKIETAVASLIAGDFSRVDFETDTFYVRGFLVDKIIRIDLKEKK